MLIQLSTSLLLATILVCYFAKPKTPTYILTATVAGYWMVTFSVLLLLTDIYEKG